MHTVRRPINKRTQKPENKEIIIESPIELQSDEEDDVSENGISAGLVSK